MKENISLSIDCVKFRSYGSDEKSSATRPAAIDRFDSRQDFLIDEDFAGIAVRIDFTNERIYHDKPRGIRHHVAITLVDVTERCEIDVRRVLVAISLEKYYRTVIVNFPSDEVEFRSCHTYKIVCHDENDDIRLGEYVFHTYGVKELGHPSAWYQVWEGGVRPDWEMKFYKSLNAVMYKDYHVRFNVLPQFGRTLPMILPELELRLRHPGTGTVESVFKEPMRCRGDEKLYFVEQEFFPSDRDNGAFYAELRCMDYPIAGFLFGMQRRDVTGTWLGDDILPIENYDEFAAIAHLNELLHEEDESEVSPDDEFEAALRRFIERELNDSGEVDSEER